MAFSVQMPALGESVTEGTITRWLKQEGDRVEVDEPLLEVSTDKVDTEIPSPAAGVLERIVAAEDETVEVGAELAVIGDGSGAPDTGTQQPAEQPAQQQAQPASSAPAQPAAPTSSGSGDTGSEGSATPVTMPALGESVTEGTVTRWLKQVGDQVEVDEPLLEVSTDKVDTEIPSPVGGTLLEIIAGEDQTVEVGGQLALVGDASAGTAAEPAQPEPRPAQPEPRPAQPEAQPARSEPRPAAEPASAGSPWSEPGSQQPAAASAPSAAPASSETNGVSPDAEGDGVPYVTPLVRKLAAEHGVDLRSVHGTGVGGRIRKQDVLAAAEKSAAASAPAPTTAPAEPAAPAPSAPRPAAPARVASPVPHPHEPSAADAAKLRGTTQKLPRLRKVIAQRMVESLQISAQLTAMQEVDVTRVAQLRQLAKADFQAREGVKLTYLPFFVKAAVDTLKLFPQVNASLDTERGEVTYHDAEHIGIAVDTERGLVVPVIHEAGDLSLAGIARQIADLAERTRTNRAKPDELSGGTFTVTNIGSFGSITDTPIINQPQVAILGTGAVVKRPVVVTDDLGQDSIAIRSIASLVLTYDHRLVDGAEAGRFLSAVKRRLETGSFETELGL
jgi:pyruvate dehydrogenase E2 component (dihydrolipoamide acetyltransferase)